MTAAHQSRSFAPHPEPAGSATVSKLGPKRAKVYLSSFPSLVSATIAGLSIVDCTRVRLAMKLQPLLPAVVSATWLLRRRDHDEEGWVADLLPRGVLRLLGARLAGNAGVVLAATGWAHAGPARPVLWSLWAPLLLLPGLAVAIMLWREARDDEWLLGPHLDGSVLPLWATRSMRPALRGAGLLVALGALLVLVTVAFFWREVHAVQVAVGGGGLAATLLWFVQAGALPNLGLWALSFLAGPGFSVVDGAGVSWSGAHSGLLPLVPVLAALPQPQSFPWFVMAGVLVPVVCGAVVARWALPGVARLSSVWTKTRLALPSVAGASLLVGALDLLGGSSLGSYRLSGIGAHAGWLVVALAVELAVGAILMVLWDAWRLRRGSRWALTSSPSPRSTRATWRRIWSRVRGVNTITQLPNPEFKPHSLAPQSSE